MKTPPEPRVDRSGGVFVGHPHSACIVEKGRCVTELLNRNLL